MVECPCSGTRKVNDEISKGLLYHNKLFRDIGVELATLLLPSMESKY